MTIKHYTMKTAILLTVLYGAVAAVSVEVPVRHDTHTSWIPRIIGGSDAELGEFPYQVSLRHIEDDIHVCAGTIISPRYILTAGHCVIDNGGPLYIVAGSVTLDNGGTRYDVEEFFSHENFDPDNNYINDVALIKTTEEIEFNGNIQQALLPSVDTFADAMVNVSGWGRISNNLTDPTNKLQKLNNYPIVNNSECSLRTDMNIYVGQICAGGVSGFGVCTWDSGSPLSENGAVIGIASLVVRPCGSGHPDVFTRVYHYVDWIVNKTQEHAHTLKYSEDLTVII